VAVNQAICHYLYSGLFQIYWRHKNGLISIKEFDLPFGGTLDSENRWAQLEGLIPWDELEEAYAG
jgi:IS5 family transposase